MSIPVLATTSSQGDITINGDFVGTGENPQLMKSGVVAGTYPLTKSISVDSKGRVTAIGTMTTAEIDALVAIGYSSNPSAFTIIGGKPVLNIADATTSAPGLVQLGSNVGNSSTIPFNLATTSTLGSVQIGAGFEMSTTSDTLPTSVASITLDAAFVWPNIQNSTTTVGYSVLKQGTRFIMVGGGSKVMYSDDSTGSGTWTAVTSPIATAYCLVGNGSSTLIALSQSASATAMRSTDNGATWTSFTLPGASTPAYTSVAWNGSVFCAVGSNSVSPYVLCATSPDGVTWTARTIGATTMFPNNIVWNGSVFITSGDDFATTNCVTFTSPDGTTWTARTSQTELLSGSSTWYDPAVFYGNSTLCMFRGPQLRIDTSTDIGATWKRVTVATTVPKYWIQASDGIYSVTFNGGNYICWWFDGVTMKNVSVPSGATRSATPQILITGTDVYIFGKTASATDRTIISKTNFKTYTVYKTVGLNVKAADILPSTGGTVNGSWGVRMSGLGTISKTSFTTGATTEAAGQATFSPTSVDQTNVSLNPTYVAVVGTTAAAAGTSLMVQVYLDASNNWYSATSTDGTTWSNQKITAPPGASPRLHGMSCDGTNFVLVGRQTTTLTSDNWTATSSDGVTWTYNSTPWTSGVQLTSGLVWSAPWSKFVSAGRNAAGQFAFVSSANGSTWTLGTVATTVGAPITAISFSAGPGGAGYANIAVAIAGGVGASATAVWYSLNGTSWTVVGNAVSVYGIPTGASITGVGGQMIYSANGPTAGVYYYNVLGYFNGALTGNGILGGVITGAAGICTALFNDGGSNYYMYCAGNWHKNAGSSLGAATSPAVPVIFNSKFVYPERGAQVLGGVGCNHTTSLAVSTNTSAPGATLQAGVSREILVTMPDDDTISTTPPNHGVVVGQIVNLVLTTSLTGSAAISYELNWKNSGYATVKVVNGNARNYLTPNSYRAVTCIYTAPGEWLVF